MKKSGRKFLSIINVLILLIFLGFSIYIYRGFFFPDSATLYLFPFAETILIIIKVLFPIIIISLILLYRLIYLKRVEPGALFLLIFASIFILLLVYPIGDYFYRNSLTVNTREFHPYLQIIPPNIETYDTNKINVFCLGGSTTEFTDEKGRDWPTMVQQEIDKDSSNQKIKIFNLGRQWYTTQHILINYLLNYRHYKPDAILVMESINDLLHNADFSWLSNGEFRGDYGNFLGPVTRLVKYQSFALFLKSIVSHLWYSENLVDVEESEFPGLKSFERNLKTIIELAKIDGTKIILMTQPNIYKDSMSVEEQKELTMLNVEALGNGKRWDYKTVAKGFQLYNNKIREIVTSNKGICLIDLEMIVPKTLEYFIDDVHYNSNTHNLIAPFLAKELMRLLSEH